jgi:PAS domain-containing protein
MFLIVMSVPLLFLAAVIEERSKAEMTLREREERISLAAESANLAFWTINFERQESWMSDQGRAIFHFGPDESLSRELFLARVHPRFHHALTDGSCVVEFRQMLNGIEHETSVSYPAKAVWIA